MKPIGINTLGNFMKTISKRLGLSIHYSYHSIRATVVTLLSSKGLGARKIMRLDLTKQLNPVSGLMKVTIQSHKKE